MNALARDLAGVRYRPQAVRGHVESYFLKANDPEGARAVWLKATIFASDHDPTRAVAEAWAIAFDREHGHTAVKTWVPYESARFSPTALDVSVASCRFTSEAWKGDIASGERSVAFDLALGGEADPLMHFPRPFLYDAPFPSTKIVSLAFDARVSGRVVVNGASWDVSRWGATVGHNWGRRHAPHYAWGHCNVWHEAGAALAFEGLTARAGVGALSLPAMTLLAVRHAGRTHTLTGALSMVKNHGDVSLRRWTFGGKGQHIAIEGEMRAETDDFVGLFYANPDGKTTHCLNSKLAHAELSVTLRGQPPMKLTSNAAALEIGTRDPMHGIRMYA